MNDAFPLEILEYAKVQGLKVERLTPSHAVAMQTMFKAGTNHIADYFVWANDASGWSTKDCLFWIQDLLRAPAPSEHFSFFRGKKMIGMAAIGAFYTGRGEAEDSKNVQMAYWIGKEHLGKHFGDRIVRIIEKYVFEYRKYQFMHLVHDNTNHNTSHMAVRLGYRFESYYDAEIKARKESGLYYCWVKQNPTMNNVRTIDFAIPA